MSCLPPYSGPCISPLATDLVTTAGQAPSLKSLRLTGDPSVWRGAAAGFELCPAAYAGTGDNGGEVSIIATGATSAAEGVGTGQAEGTAPPTEAIDVALLQALLAGNASCSSIEFKGFDCTKCGANTATAKRARAAADLAARTFGGDGSQAGSRVSSRVASRGGGSDRGDSRLVSAAGGRLGSGGASGRFRSAAGSVISSMGGRAGRHGRAAEEEEDLQSR